VWEDIKSYRAQGNQATGYVTQKPEKLLYNAIAGPKLLARLERPAGKRKCAERSGQRDVAQISNLLYRSASSLRGVPASSRARTGEHRAN
jgi:hypothetical protein